MAWSAALQSTLRKLDDVQRRAQRIISEENDMKLDSLKHRRNVAGLTVFFKANIQLIHHT